MTLHNEVTDPIEREKFFEDISRPNPKALFSYTVVVDINGAIHTQLMDASDEVVRKATTFDVYSSSRDLVNDIESQLLADRVAKRIEDVLKPNDDAKELREKLLSALSDRGIETPKA